MSKLFKKGRPSPAMVIAVIALIAGLGGGAYAAKSKKVTFKGLDKDARNKVLPISAHKSITADCEPTSATYVDCAAVTLNQSTGFPRRAMIVVDGTFTTAPAGGRGECRLELDNAPIANARARIGENGTGGHSGEHGDGFGINHVTGKVPGKHTFGVECNEGAGDIHIRDLQITAMGIRG